MSEFPEQYLSIKKRFSKFFTAAKNLGKATSAAGPINKKTAQLIQLAAAAAIKSEGSVHSHAKRALDAGAKPDELYHAIILTTSIIGFPSVSAALSWVDDVIQKQ